MSDLKVNEDIKNEQKHKQTRKILFFYYFWFEKASIYINIA